MSEVECKAGTISKIMDIDPEKGFMATLLEVQKQFDFTPEDIDIDYKYVWWGSPDKKKEIVCLHDAFWLVEYTTNNRDLWMNEFWETGGKIHFAQVFYNGGTDINGILERHLATSPSG